MKLMDVLNKRTVMVTVFNNLKPIGPGSTVGQSSYENISRHNGTEKMTWRDQWKLKRKITLPNKQQYCAKIHNAMSCHIINLYMLHIFFPFANLWNQTQNNAKTNSKPLRNTVNVLQVSVINVHNTTATLKAINHFHTIIILKSPIELPPSI